MSHEKRKSKTSAMLISLILVLFNLIQPIIKLKVNLLLKPLVKTFVNLSLPFLVKNGFISSKVSDCGRFEGYEAHCVYCCDQYSDLF